MTPFQQALQEADEIKARKTIFSEKTHRQLEEQTKHTRKKPARSPDFARVAALIRAGKTVTVEDTKNLPDWERRALG